MADIKLKLKVRKPVTRVKRMDTEKLKNETVKRHYHDIVDLRWQTEMKKPPTSVECEWTSYKTHQTKY